MAILTIPNTILKNSFSQFGLNKSYLSSFSTVSLDIYFSDTSNWKQVLAVYKSSTGNQKKIIKFNPEIPSPIADVFFSLKAKNSFQIQKIIILDFDNGVFTIERSELNASEFDIFLS